MSSIPLEPSQMRRAEKQFREAFDRLRRGKPNLVPKGTKVTQNNVAREAGLVPSALRRSRFPVLVAEIQQWIDANPNAAGAVSPRQMALARRSHNRGLRIQLGALRVQRDDALSKLVEAEAAILDLVVENERLRAQLPETAPTPLHPLPRSS